MSSNDEINLKEANKISLAELMRKKLESQKQSQQKGASFSKAEGSNKKIKNQNSKRSTLHRARTGE